MRGFSYVKKSSTIFLSLVLFLSTLGIIVPNVHAQFAIAVEPDIVVRNPSETFSINVTIQDVYDLFSYEMKIGINETVLQPLNAQEGPFIRDYTESPTPPLFNFIIDPGGDYIYVYCVTIGPYPGISGSGLLFTANFKVKAPGESYLHLYDINLRDSTNTEIVGYSTSDGFFHTTQPVASFTFSPRTLSRPIVGENVTFDALSSFDPDGGTIVSYTWDFNDTTTGTGAVVRHIYNSPSTPLTPYNVTLTVVDDEGMNHTTWLTFHVRLHDMAIVDITGPDEIFVHQIALFNVTVVNNGSHAESSNTTLYYNSMPIGTNSSMGLAPGANQSLTYYWNTFINQTTTRFYSQGIGTWSSPLNATTSDDFYTYSNVNLASQEFLGYNATTTGWTGISKVEIGIEAWTETGGDDQISVQVYSGTTWTPTYTRNITSTTDTFLWVDVTGTLSWTPGMVQRGMIRARIRYIQVGPEATPIYVDWIPIRITPANPADIPEGTYALWANTLLVHDVTRIYRPGEESNETDNTLLGKSVTVTNIPSHNISVEIEQVTPTEVAIGRTSTVRARIRNLGNVDEIVEVRLYSNGTLVASQTNFRLGAGSARTLTFAWFTATNTTVEGNYNVTVYAPPVVGETDTANNMHNVTVLMKLLPVAYFTFSPSLPDIGEDVQFDASGSYAPGAAGGSIVEYRWNFGDDTTGTGALVTHAFAQSGAKSVQLTVIDDEGLNNTRTMSVPVQKFVSTITIAGSLTTVPLSLNTTISGSISPVRANVNVKINSTILDENVWTTIANLTSDDAGQYSFVWIPDTLGEYQIKAFWPGDDTTLAATSSLLNVTVIRRDLAVAKIDLSKIWIKPGDSVRIDVTASNKGSEPETFNVNVYYNDTLIEAKPVTALVAGGTRKVSFDWDTTDIEEGVYLIKGTAESLSGESSPADNSISVSCVVQKAQVVSVLADVFVYTTIALAIVIVIMAIYLFRMMRAKSKPT